MSRLMLPVGERDHVRGNPRATVTLVEYGDFECPHCGRAHGILDELLDELGAGLRLVFRHFPITTLHPHAERAALAAEAAGAQGHFWEMHDLLFETQDALEDDDLRRNAESLELDLDRFDDEMARAVHLPRVRQDFTSGVRSGVNGTPTFYINGARHDAPYDYPVLLDALRHAVRV
jgi:protein-disulfide isomerase